MYIEYMKAQMMWNLPVVFRVQNQNRRLDLPDPMGEIYDVLLD